jgi:hypothetical protein
VFIIGIDPHQGSHTAAVLDCTETVIGKLRVLADRRQRERLLNFATGFTPRTWAIECLGAGCAARPAAGRGRRDGAGCAPDAVGSGAAARRWLHRQDRPARRPGGGDRGAAAQPAAPGHPGGSHRGAAAICRLRALLGGLTPGRCWPPVVGSPGRADAARRKARGAGRERTQADGPRAGGRCSPVRQPAPRHPPSHRRGRPRVGHDSHRHPRHRSARRCDHLGPQRRHRPVPLCLYQPPTAQGGTSSGSRVIGVTRTPWHRRHGHRSPASTSCAPTSAGGRPSDFIGTSTRRVSSVAGTPTLT